LGTVAQWRIDPRLLPVFSSNAVVRVIGGAQASEFGEEFFSTVFKVSSRSDRMGLRLEGTRLARSTDGELLSTAVAPGTIQVPPNGEPLVLMADAQTIGGYPQIGHVISVDMPVLAQLRPGASVKFAPVTLSEAHRLALLHDHAVALLREGLLAKLRSVTESTFARLRSAPSVEP
jgi:antagonist of KipI